LRRHKCGEFWRHTVDSERSNPRRLWQTVDRILGRSKPPPCDQIDVERVQRILCGES
jgi:hypothetical protein